MDRSKAATWATDSRPEKDSSGSACPLSKSPKARKQNAKNWWGDVEESVRYGHAAIDQTCARFGGDPDALILCGFSRGSIGCNFIGLHDDRIAARWRGVPLLQSLRRCSHGLALCGRGSGLGARTIETASGPPQFICMERSTADIEDYLKQTGISGDFTFVTIPFENHNDRWILRDIPERRQAREWLARVVKPRLSGPHSPVCGHRDKLSMTTAWNSAR